MYQILLLIHVFIAVFIIGMVLIQQGKGASMGAAFGSGASQTVFGSRGSGSFLFRLTITFALLFFATSILLNYLTMHAYKQAKTQQPILPTPQGVTAPQRSTAPLQQTAPQRTTAPMPQKTASPAPQSGVSEPQQGREHAAPNTMIPTAAAPATTIQTETNAPIGTAPVEALTEANKAANEVPIIKSIAPPVKPKAKPKAKATAVEPVQPKKIIKKKKEVPASQTGDFIIH